MEGEAGVVLKSVVSRDSHVPQDAGLSSHVYDNRGFEPQKEEAPSPTTKHSSAGSNTSDDTANANTHTDSTDIYCQVKKDDENSANSPTANTNGLVEGGEKGEVRQSYRRKDSSVGFRLPAGADRKASTASHSAPFRGMGKEELLRHSAKPFWRRLRYACMAVVLLGWLGLIITVVALVLIYPPCRGPPEREWWQTAVVYRIYVRSFRDKNGDGIGDLMGIEDRLDYLKNIGVTAISLSPIYPTSPGSVSDLDILDHRDIHPDLGTMEDFRSLVNQSHAKGIKVILDFIPNLTSKNHSWFAASANSSDISNSKRNYYVWEEGLGRTNLTPPNNWMSVYDSSAWSYDDSRDMFYLHNFQSSQPELNLRSSEVKKELTDVLQFWLNMEADGFYIRNSGYLFQDYDLRNEPLLPNATDNSTYRSYDHTYTYGLSEVHDMFARWRTYLDYYNKTKKYIVLFADRTGTLTEVLQYYGRFNRDGVNFPLNNFCLELNQSSEGRGVAKVVSQWMNSMPSNRWANWLGGTDTSERLIDRMGEEMVRPFMMLIMLMPGTPVVYYGDEIGMRGFRWTEVDKGQRNLSMRSPMQWNANTSAGFCNCTSPWMEINPTYTTVNVKAQMSEDDSLYYLFTNLTALRADNPSFQYGDFNEAVLDDDVYSFVRDYDGVKGFLVALNFANRTVTKSFRGAYKTIPTSGSVVLVTKSDAVYKKGDSVSCSNVQLGPYQGLVLSWNFVAKEL